MTVKTNKMDAAKKSDTVPFSTWHMKDYTDEQRHDVYWTIIEAYDWDANSNECIEQVQRKMVDRFGNDILIAASEFARKKKGELYQIVDAYEKNNDERCGDYGGDDSFGDMLAHAVSKGKDYFESVCKDPTILNDLDYTECFSYVLIDSSEDINKFEVYKHVNMAYQLWGKLNYHKEYYQDKDAGTWAKVAVMFDNVLEAIGEGGDGDMEKLWATVGTIKDNRELYNELGEIGHEYPNILNDMCRCLFDWDNLGEVQLELF